MEKAPTIIVAVSRQLGSGGSYIAQQAARTLNYRYMDREILRQAARRLGREVTELSGREEKCSSLWEKIVRIFSPGAPEAPYVPPASPLLDDREIFEAEGRIIQRVSDDHDAVIVGRGAVQVLKTRPGLVSLFVHARKDFRVKRIMEIYKIRSAHEALSMVEQSDRQRAEFIRTMTGSIWWDARNYHLSIDTSASGLAPAVEMVLSLVRRTKERRDFAEKGEGNSG